MREYTVNRTTVDVPLAGTVSGTPWADAVAFRIDEFSWHDGGPKPLTTGRALYDDRAIYLQYHAEDTDIAASVTELNGPTYRDSSVEFFADPTPDDDSRYFNFEPNCCGQFKLAWQERDWEARGIGRDLVSSDVAATVDVETSVPGPTKDPHPDDEEWWLAAALPFDALEALTGVTLAPTSGTEWRGNFYRSGVPTAQKATWNPIEKPEPDYHSPEYFGRIRFE
ncbi:carbohydrate-binding family 9-like protein [Haloterrigena salifodinae]|uniref:carbohydrate-binding family 9-like protein n=1 Tax=Haloterrigena salifodinae TaxID=2675099 RepID=UPI000F89BF08|nr:carbohydrate-binding family 9-like protein [Haloterrigena salifodinae]